MYYLYSTSIKKFRTKPIEFEIFKGLCDLLRKAGLVGLFGVFKEEKLLSFVIVLRVDKNLSLAFIQGTEKEGYKYGASSYLFHNTILREFKRGTKIFSFGLSPPYNKGLIFFKESFGSFVYEYPVYIYQHPFLPYG
jgi:lipid II:glycine glycyltransferase (peptidoglycan interpeptide bridge formation enzyme)